MRLVTLAMIIGGLLGWIYIGFHLYHLVSQRRKKEKKGHYLLIIIGALCLFFWFFSFVKFSWLMAVAIYGAILYVIFDLLYLLFVKKLKIWKGLFKGIYAIGLPLLIALLFSLYGIYNADQIVVKDYQVSVHKEMEKPFTIAMMGDSHIGSGVTIKDLESFDEQINSLEANALCMVGDIFDENTTKEEILFFGEKLKEVNTTYGIYYVYGNHDVGKYEGKSEEYYALIDQVLRDAGVYILEDESVLVNNQLYIVGRKDFSMFNVPEKEENRKNQIELLADLDKKYPIVLLDHRPMDTEESMKAGVDLQLSGHTHDGQLWPMGFIAEKIAHKWDLSYGEEESGDYTLIVTSGYGTWGIPVRTAGHSEITKIVVTGT